jgi:hypothetical protein
VTDPTDALMDLVFMASDHAIESLAGGGPLTPFVVVQSGPRRTLERFVADTLEASEAQMRRAVGSLDASVTAFAMVYDGFLTVDGEKFDAVLIEGGERGAPAAFEFAQRYRPRRCSARPRPSATSARSASWRIPCGSRQRFGGGAGRSARDHKPPAR